MTVSSRVSFTVTQVSSDFLDFFPTFFMAHQSSFSSGLCQSGDRESSIIIIITFILIHKISLCLMVCHAGFFAKNCGYSKY